MVNQHVFHAIQYNDIPIEDRNKIINSHMFNKEKFLPTGEFEKIKARLVADTVPDEEKMSPTVAVSSILLLAAIAGTSNM